MKKEEKEAFLEKFFSSIKLENFSHEEIKILELFPFFNKEMVEVLDKVILLNTSFRMVDFFQVEYDGRSVRCFLIEILHDAHSSLCIKYSKIFKSGKTLFLGFKGLDILSKKYPEKIKSEMKRIYSFDSNKSTNKNYIPGVEDNKGNPQRILPKLDFTLRKGSYIAVFKE